MIEFDLLDLGMGIRHSRIGGWEEHGRYVLDPIDAFWELVVFEHIVYERNLRKVRWLLKRGINFTVEVRSKESLNKFGYFEELFYKIRITNRNDALLFKLSYDEKKE